MKDEKHPPVKSGVSEMRCDVSDDDATLTGHCRSGVIASINQVSNFLCTIGTWEKQARERQMISLKELRMH
jgi:hypothetical protein